jgi:dsRNA-specific ribonuclease
MKQSIEELISKLAEKGTLLQEMRRLLQQEQSCLVALDLTRLEENQQEIARTMEKMEQLSDTCKAMIAAIGAELGLPGNATLSPIIDRMAQPEKGALKEAQSRIAADSKALGGDLALNRGLLEDSLKVVERSVSFFNRLFSPGDTYGLAGSLVSRRGASHFVCKEI